MQKLLTTVEQGQLGYQKDIIGWSFAELVEF